MKKAKIMLMAIAVIALVGGALAFKTAKFTKGLFYCTTTVTGGPQVCTLGFYSTLPGSPTSVPTSAVFTTITSHPTTTPVCPAAVNPLLGCYTAENPSTVFLAQ